MIYETTLYPHRDNGAIARAPGVKTDMASLFGFKFKRDYGCLYTTRHDRFVLREEHVAELKRVTTEYNKAHARRIPALSMSDVLNAALDFIFEHPVALARLQHPDDFREDLAKEIYRKAFVHFVLNDLL